MMVMGAQWENTGTGAQANVRTSGFERESSQQTENSVDQWGSNVSERELREASFEQNAWDTLVCNGFLEVYLPLFKCWREA